MNTPYLYARNICREGPNGTYIFYSTGNKDINLKSFGRQCDGLLFESSLDFRWGWKYSWNHRSVPSTVSWRSEEGIFISQQFLPHHIYHFSESVNQLLLKFVNRSQYPVLTHLYLPRFDNQTEFVWSKTYLELLIKIFPPAARPSLLFSSPTNQYGLECFRSAVCIPVSFHFRLF